jgi:hypothetical protein
VNAAQQQRIGGAGTRQGRQTRKDRHARRPMPFDERGDCRSQARNRGRSCAGTPAFEVRGNCCSVHGETPSAELACRTHGKRRKSLRDASGHR